MTTEFRHAYREGHSTSTTLTQMTDDWLREIDDKNIVGAVLLDFSAVFDIIDHSLLLEKHICYGFTPPAILWIKSYLTNRTQRAFFNGSLAKIIQVKSGILQSRCLGPLRFQSSITDQVTP
jgi:hypothetical protein